ncbi:MAG: PAS domain S-box protein [Methanoregula sp.]|jgi:PAS domain S-box-containing protein
MMADTIRVLYVDDESALLDLCKVFLERTGEFTVTTTTSAPEVLTLVREKTFDVIVSDYQMPEVNGIELLVALRAAGNTTPYIVFTGKGREEVVIAALNAGADFYIQKGGESKAQFAELSHKIKKAAESRQSQRALEKSEEKYRRIVETANEGIWILDDHLRITYTNQRMVELLGYTREELIGKEIRTFMPDAELADHAIRRSRQHEGIQDHFLRRFQRKDGNTLWTAVSTTPIMDENGKYSGSVAMYSDITERKQAEDALHETSAQLMFALSSARAGTWSWEHLKKTLVWSPGFYSLFGLSPDAPPSFETWLSLVHPDDRKTTQEKIEKAALSRRDLWTECRILLPDGGVRWIGISGSTTLTSEGEPLRTSGICIDITGRRNAEEALRKSEERSRFISEMISDFTYSCKKATDGQYAIDWISGAVEKITGYTPEELSQKMCWRSLVIDEDLPIFDRNISGLSLGDRRRAEIRIRRKDGRIICLAAYAKCVADPTHPECFQLIGACRDISERKRGEQALKESEERFRALAGSASDIIRILDRNGKITFDTDAAARLLGYPAGFSIGKSPLEFIHPDDCARVTENFDQVYESSNPGLPTEFRMRRADGSYTWVESVGKNFFGVSGVDGVVITTRFIDDRKRAEDALKESEERFRAIAEQITEIIYITDINGLVTYISPAVESVSGYTPSEILGRHFTTFIPQSDLGKIVPLETATQMHILPLKDFCIHFQRKDGSCVSVELNCSSFTCGAFTGMVGVIRDISGRKKTEMALVESEERYRALVDHALEPILIFDFSGTALFANHATAALVGVDDPHVLVGRNALEFVAPESHDAVLSDFMTVLQGTDAYLAQYKILTVSGRECWVEAIGKKIQYRCAPADLVMLRDITGRKAAEEALRLVHQKLNLLASITRHDILNQLLALKGYLTLSYDWIDNPQKVAEFIKKEELVAQTIEEQITFTREYQEMGVSEPVWQHIGDCFRQVQAQLPMRDVSVTVACDGLEIYADPLLQKVFFNLCENGLRHGSERMRSIRISAQRTDGGMKLIYEDDGVGIPAADKKRLFTRGFGKHTGLGLFLSREVLGITGITITENGVPGVGARFEIRVPEGMYRFTGAVQ